MSSSSDEPSRPEPPEREPGPERIIKATALSYERGERAPHVVASGRGETAKRIIELAQEAGVPVRSDPALAEALQALKIDAEIPAELYRAVAAALAWAYRTDGKLGSRPRR